MAFILRDLDPVFWSRVQTKARAEGQSIKAVIVRLLTQWLGVVAALAIVVLTACAAPLPTTPTPVVVSVAPAASIELVGGSATSSHQVLFHFIVRDAIGLGVAAQRVTLSTTAGTLDYRLVMTGTSGSGQALLTTTEDAIVTATTGDFSATAEGTAYFVVLPLPPPPPPPTPPPPPPTCATDPTLCPPPAPPPPPTLSVALSCTAVPHLAPTPCNVTVQYGGVPLRATEISRVDWNWGDGFSNTTVAPSAPISTRVYANAGRYTVFATVTATTADGPKIVTTTSALVIP